MIVFYEELPICLLKSSWVLY